MPLYEFICKPCQASFEVIATFQEKERGLKPTCPHCQGDQVQQVMTTGMFVGKAAGFAPTNTNNVCAPGAGRGCCG